MNKYLYGFILMFFDIFIIGFLPILFMLEVSSTLGYWLIICFIVLHLRDLFIKKYEPKEN